MFTLKWLPARGICRGKPALPHKLGRRLAVLGLVVVFSVLETGCQSGPFSPCGFVGRTTSRVRGIFRHSQPADACCGTTVATDGGCFPSAMPVETISSPIITPGIPGATPSNVAPADTPSSLEALPKAEPGPAQSIRKLPSGTGTKTNSTEDLLRPDNRAERTRNDNLAHSLASASVPASRSAQSASRSVARDTGDGESALDQMPPLDLPAEATEKIMTPPVAPAAERSPASPPALTDPLMGRSSPETQNRPAVATPSLSAPALAAPPTSATEPAPATGAAPGLSRFVAVDLKLAAGSTPTSAGLDWLTDKGYRTIVDLREPSEISVSFIGEAAKRGLRYIPLPITAGTIDRAHLERFQFELTSSDARPLYFFDADGNRAATLWYIHRITVDRVDRQIAHREAEEIGLSNPAYASAAARYLEQLESHKAQVTSNGPAVEAGSARTPALEALPRQTVPTPATSKEPVKSTRAS